MGADCDDAVALALLLHKMRRGECKILCVTAATARRGAAATVSAICSAYSCPDIPVGKMAPPPLSCDKEDAFAAAVAELYRKKDTETDAVSLMRRTLEEAEGKVVLAEIGPLTNVARLLRSLPDGYSEKSGIELVRQKAEGLFVMGGSFRENYAVWGRAGQSLVREWNIAQDIASARFVAENFPVPLCFVPFEAGAEVYAEIREAENDPVWDCAREFARKHGLPIVQVVEGDISEAAYEGDGKHINSSFADGMDNESAKAAIIKKLEELGKGKRVVNYKLRDWIFSRQRYWGEPIPVAKLEDGTEFPLPLDQLPLTLPELDSYEPSKDGKPPLSRAPKEWLDYVAPDGRKGQRETNTMPQWAGSCWYYIRYIDPHNDSCIGDKELLDHWLPVDLYVGGAEHAVLHLLYARFWHKFLYDIGAVSCKEPFKKLFHQGMILGANGEKMSKSRGNVVNPDDIVKSHGADSLRLFEMFAGPLQEAKPWSTSGLDGAKRFIERVYRIVDEEGGNRLTNENDGSLDSSYAKMVKKVSEDYESLAFNTAISAMMVFINDCYKAKSIYRPYFEGFVKVFSCLCPFVGEQMWNMLGHDDLITYQSWPTYDESKLAEAKKNIAVSINGKTRDVIAMDADIDQDGALALAAASPKIKPYLEGKAPRKVIFVKGRILNIVL